MAKILLTKNELKRQKDALKRFYRYLPTLILKKQQLQAEILKVEAAVGERSRRLAAQREELGRWVGLLGSEAAPDSGLEAGVAGLLPELRLRVAAGNIAGIDIPVYQDLEISEAPYDLFATPLWVDQALQALVRILKLEAEILVLEEQRRRLAHELRITTQRVNLFEKVKIPEAREAIRRIQIYLGDQQTAAVVRGKIAKGKLVRGE